MNNHKIEPSTAGNVPSWRVVNHAGLVRAVVYALADAERIKALLDGYTTPPTPSAPLVADAIAQALWHRFGDDSRVEWEDEPEKAIYRDAAAQVIALATAEQPEARGVEGMAAIIADIRHSALVDDYEPQQIAFLESIAERLAATPNPVRAEQPEGKGAWLRADVMEPEGTFRTLDGKPVDTPATRIAARIARDIYRHANQAGVCGLEFAQMIHDEVLASAPAALGAAVGVEGETVAGFIDRLGERIRRGMAEIRRFGANASHGKYMDDLAAEAIAYAANLAAAPGAGVGVDEEMVEDVVREAVFAHFREVGDKRYEVLTGPTTIALSVSSALITALAGKEGA